MQIRCGTYGDGRIWLDVTYVLRMIVKGTSKKISEVEGDSSSEYKKVSFILLRSCYQLYRYKLKWVQRIWIEVPAVYAMWSEMEQKSNGTRSRVVEEKLEWNNCLYSLNIAGIWIDENCTGNRQSGSSGASNEFLLGAFSLLVVGWIWSKARWSESKAT